MKLQKNKIVFVLVLVCVVLFTAIYTVLRFGKDKKVGLDPERIPMPDLEGKPVEYESKLKAIEAIKEERETNAPELYPDHMVDDKGYFNPDYMEYEKQRIIDSVYNHSERMAKRTDLQEVKEVQREVVKEKETPGDEMRMAPEPISIQERSLSHQLFFASDPSGTQGMMVSDSGQRILAYVDGDQTIRDGHRLNLRLEQEVQFQGVHVLKYSRVYGFVKIKPNRVMVEIVGLGDLDISLKAFDFQDGREGIYVENHLGGEVMERGVDETIGEVNVPGLPQIRGLKRIFQRRNKAIKVDISDKYQVVLKPVL